MQVQHTTPFTLARYGPALLLQKWTGHTPFGCRKQQQAFRWNQQREAALWSTKAGSMPAALMSKAWALNTRLVARLGASQRIIGFFCPSRATLLGFELVSKFPRLSSDNLYSLPKKKATEQG